MSCYQKRRGVSETVGTLMMLAIVVGLGMVIFTVASGGLAGLSGSYATAMSNRESAISEKFAVEQVTFTFPGGLATDGTITNQVGGSSSSIAATLSTGTANDVIVAYVSPANTGSTTPPSVSGISGGGLTWSHRTTTSTETFTQDNYVPFTLQNNANGPTPNPFQQKVTWNPSTYATYESSDLGNIRFCLDTLCATQLYAWLESCTGSCGTGASSATAWVRLTSQIGANGGTLTIYMVFKASSVDFDNNYWGEAPNLSGTYGQHDNGANVFTFYDSFIGTSLSSKWTIVQSGSGAVTVNNGATFTTPTSASDWVFIVSAAQTYPLVSESYMVSDNSGADPMVGVSTTASSNNHVALYNGYSLEWTASGGTQEWYNGAGNNYGQIASQNQAVFPAGIWQVTWSATGSEYFQDGVGNVYTGTDNTVTIANYRVFLGESNFCTCSDLLSRWARMRAYPPSNVMPTATPGATGSATITFDLEEWYATASSPLSSVLVTATLSGTDTAATWIAVFGIKGANTGSPFDASLPATSAGTSPSVTISTSNANDMLLYACAAGAGGMASGFTSVYSSTYPPNQNEYVGYDVVSTTQTNLVISCGSNSYGTEIADAVVASTTGGADIYVRNVGSMPNTLVSVYITDLTSNSFVEQVAISTTVNVGAFADIPYVTLSFVPSHGHTYSFTVTSSLGNAVAYSVGAT